MPGPLPENSARTSSPESPWLWPWAQIGWFLAGVAFSFIEIEKLAFVLGWAQPSAAHDISTPMLLAVLLIYAAAVCSIPAALLRWRFIRRPQPPIHLPWMRKVNFGLLTIVLLAGLSASMITAIYGAREAALQAAAAGPWQDHVLANGRVQISTPADWEVLSDPSMPNSVIRLVDHRNDLQLAVSVTQKQDLAIQSLAEFSQLAAQTLARQGTNTSSSALELGEVDGRSTARFTIEGTFEGINATCGICQLDCHDAWVELRLWATRSRFPAHEATLAKIASSVRYR